jgi:hypothetical protein
VGVERPAALSLSIAPRPGCRLHASAPVELRVVGEGVRLPRATFTREAAVDPRAEVPRFEVPIVGERAGTAQVTAKVTFYVCRAALCRPVETEARWTFEVEPR